MRRMLSCLFLLLVSGAPALAGGFSSDAQQAIAALKAFNSGWNDLSATLDVTSEGKGSIKQHGVAQMHSIAKDDRSQKIRMRVESPPGARGTSFLSHVNADGGMRQWMFLPASGNTMEIQTSGRSSPFLGTEFSFEDLVVHPGRFQVKDAGEKDCEVAGKEVDCQVITLNPAAGTSSYDRLDAWLDEEEYRLRQVDFYGKDKLLKTLVLEDYRQFADKHWLAGRLTMTNAKTGRSTVLLWKDVQFDSGLEVALFEPDKLGEGVAQTRSGPR